MKPRLLWDDRDLPLEDGQVPAKTPTWTDLDMDAIADAMARDDQRLRATVAVVLAAPLQDAAAIGARQDVLADIAQAMQPAQQLHDLALGALDARRRGSGIGIFGIHPSSILYGSVEIMREFVGVLRQVRDIAEAWAPRATARPLARWLDELRGNLGEAYLEEIGAHLDRLGSRGPLPLRAALGPMNESASLTLAAEAGPPPPWWQRLLGYVPSKHTVRIADRDEAGARALAELRDKGLNEVANALAQSVDYLMAFFGLVQRELAFYLAAARWRQALADGGVPTCRPSIEAGAAGIVAEGLLPLSVALRQPGVAVPNDIDTRAAPVALITGPNQGGKTTFLRAMGQAQWLAQAGLPVPARAWRCPLFDGWFTHFKQAEDDALEHGKFDEELGRWNAIVDAIGRHALVLSNESFASTDEREATQLAATLFRALAEAGHQVVAVTHLSGLGAALEDHPGLTNWRVDRGEGGRRPYVLRNAPPGQGSFARDIFADIFAGANAGAADDDPDHACATPAGVVRSRSDGVA